jgi:hypothetical protein
MRHYKQLCATVPTSAVRTHTQHCVEFTLYAFCYVCLKCVVIRRCAQVQCMTSLQELLLTINETASSIQHCKLHQLWRSCTLYTYWRGMHLLVSYSSCYAVTDSTSMHSVSSQFHNDCIAWCCCTSAGIVLVARTISKSAGRQCMWRAGVLERTQSSWHRWCTASHNCQIQARVGHACVLQKFMQNSHSQQLCTAVQTAL